MNESCLHMNESCLLMSAYESCLHMDESCLRELETQVSQSTHAFTNFFFFASFTAHTPFTTHTQPESEHIHELYLEHMSQSTYAHSPTLSSEYHELSHERYHLNMTNSVISAIAPQLEVQLSHVFGYRQVSHVKKR